MHPGRQYGLAAAAAVASDRLLDFLGVLGQVCIDLLVGQAQVAEDALVERLRLLAIITAAPAQERLEDGRSEQRVAAGLSRGGGHGYARRAVTASVWLLAGGGRIALRRYTCWMMERMLFTKMYRVSPEGRLSMSSEKKTLIA
jgi:hypothetical protein